jgi:hypothetical protein
MRLEMIERSLSLGQAFNNRFFSSLESQESFSGIVCGLFFYFFVNDRREDSREANQLSRGSLFILFFILGLLSLLFLLCDRPRMKIKMKMNRFLASINFFQ